MRAVAKWLVARPLNGVLVLAATSSPYLGFLSAALVVLLVLHDGTRVAAFKAAGAALLLAVIGVIVGTPPSVILVVAVVYWLSLIHISEPTRPMKESRMPSSA